MFFFFFFFFSFTNLTSRLLDLDDVGGYDDAILDDILHSEEVGVEEQRVLLKIWEIKESVRVSVL